MFSILPLPCVTRFDEDKALYEVRMENKGDLPIEKSISKIAVLAIDLAIFTAVKLVQKKEFLLCFLFQNSLHSSSLEKLLSSCQLI